MWVSDMTASLVHYCEREQLGEADFAGSSISEEQLCFLKAVREA